MSALMAPAEQAYRRAVLFAAEVLDGVTLARISAGLTVAASGMRAPPIVNASGLFVWLDEGAPPAPHTVSVDPGELPYLAGSAPVLADRLVRIVLAPGRAYRYPAGSTALRITLHAAVPGGSRPAAGATVFLRWFDGDAVEPWTDAPLRARTDAFGAASLALRLAPGQEAGKTVSGALRVRVCALAGADVRMSEEIALDEGRVTDRAEPLVINLA